MSLENFHKLANKFSAIQEIEDAAKKTRANIAFNDALRDIKKELRKKKDKTELLAVLTWEFQRGRLKEFSTEWHELNELEAATCTLECEMHKKIQSGRHAHFEVGHIYKCSKVFDPATLRDVVTIFGSKIRSSEEQMTEAMQQKLRMGIAPTEADYLPPKEFADRIILAGKEFNKYFRIVEKYSLDDIVEENDLAI